MSKKILLIFEGKSTEPEIFSSIKKYFFKESENYFIESIFDAELFQFIKCIKEDPYLDLIGLLKQRGKWNDILDKYESTEDFTSIYLFFDHDAHSHLDNVSIQDYHQSINEIISIFNDETENGKLYISYPMVEAVRDPLVEPQECSADCCSYISLNTQYKYNVNTFCKKQDFKKWTLKDWHECITENIIRCIVLQKNDFSVINGLSYELMYPCLEQSSLLQRQLDFYLRKEGRIVVISAFAIFIQEYYGKSLFEQLNFADRMNKYCSYFCLKS